MANEAVTLRWEGTANVSISGSGIQNVDTGTPNQITFNFGPTGFSGQLGLLIAEPYGAAPNNPRNFTLIRDKFQALYDAGERINPDWLHLNQDMRLLRMMTANQTNRDITVPLGPSQAIDWSARSTLDRPTYTNFGNEVLDEAPYQVNHLPIEVQVEICNKVNSDGWFNFPHNASDDYITQMVTYVFNNLNSNLIAHFELSNEVWNFSFNHRSYFYQEGITAWPAASGDPEPEISFSAQGKRCVEAAAIVDSIYSGNESRRANVLGTQTWDVEASPDSPLYHLMNAVTWQTYDPGTYIKPASVHQAAAVATYYGTTLVDDVGSAAIAAQYAAGTHLDYLYGLMTDPAKEYSIQSSRQATGWTNDQAKTEGLDLLQYEGGRHYLHGAQTTGDALTALLEFARSDYDADLMLQMWNDWKDIGDGPVQVFATVGSWSNFGAWTYAEYYGDTSPYAEMLFTLNKYTPNWWGGTGDYSNPSILGASDYSIPTGDSSPITNTSYFHVFGHSLFMYDGGDAAPPTPLTRTGEWLGLLAGASGNISVGSFTFVAIPAAEALDWNNPANISINGAFDIGNTSPYTGDLSNSNYTDFYTMSSNFDIVGNPPFNEDITPIVNALEELIDDINLTHPDHNLIYYVHWQDAGNPAYNVDTSNSRVDFTIYNNDVMGDYLDWHIDIQNQVIADGYTQLKVFPVGAIIAWLFENESYLQPLLFYDVYGDSAPHGSENIYLLAAMVCYRSLYGTGPDLSNFTIPPSATQIIPEVANNLVAIDAAIRDRIVFHRSNGVRV
jgi:hypothetical protein